jgi:hypothetical protein
MKKRNDRIVSGYARMWPREVLYLEDDLLQEVRESLRAPGVYVLYKDEHPYYVGRTDQLYKRLRWHADNPRARHFHFWNSFSVYVTTKHSEVEGNPDSADAHGEPADTEDQEDSASGKSLEGNPQTEE